MKYYCKKCKEKTAHTKEFGSPAAPNVLVCNICGKMRRVRN